MSQFEAGNGLSFIEDRNNTNNGYPILSSCASGHKNILSYDCGRQICRDCGNIISAAEDEHHSFDETATPAGKYSDGFSTLVCRYCNASEINITEKSQWHVEPKDGVYTISLPQQLMWYSAAQNAGLLPGNETLALSADLDMKNYDFMPIGSGDTPFTGSIEGGAHTVKNLNIEAEVSPAGLIAKAGQGAVIRNLVIDGATVESKGAAGALIGSVTASAVVRLENIAITVSSVTSDDVAGAIVGSSDGAALRPLRWLV